MERRKSMMSLGKYKTRKEDRADESHWQDKKKDLKKRTARLSRKLDLEDRTPYNKLEDPWNYD